MDRRTCKHLLEHLGAEFDRWRCGPDGGVYTPAPKLDTPKLLLGLSVCLLSYALLSFVQLFFMFANPSLFVFVAANKWEESMSPVGWWM